MAKKREPIKVTAYIHVGDQLVDVDTLTPNQRDYVGARLRMEFLNSIHRGQAVFTTNLPPRESVFPEAIYGPAP